MRGPAQPMGRYTQVQGVVPPTGNNTQPGGSDGLKNSAYTGGGNDPAVPQDMSRPGQERQLEDAIGNGMRSTTSSTSMYPDTPHAGPEGTIPQPTQMAFNDKMFAPADLMDIRDRARYKEAVGADVASGEMPTGQGTRSQPVQPTASKARYKFTNKNVSRGFDNTNEPVIDGSMLFRR